MLVTGKGEAPESVQETRVLCSEADAHELRVNELGQRFVDNFLLELDLVHHVRELDAGRRGA